MMEGEDKKRMKGKGEMVMDDGKMVMRSGK